VPVKVILEHNLTYAPAVWLIEKLLEIKVMYFAVAMMYISGADPLLLKAKRFFQFMLNTRPQNYSCTKSHDEMISGHSA